MRTRTATESYTYSSFAAPIAIWFGFLIFNLVEGGFNELLIRTFWHTLLSIFLIIGSLIISAPIAAIVLKLPALPYIPNHIFLPAALVLGILCAAAFIHNLGNMTPENHLSIIGVASLVLGLALNTLFFIRFLKENET